MSSADVSAPIRKKSHKNLYLISGTALIIIIVSVVVFLMRNKEQPIQITTEPSIRKSITQIVSATGKIQPETEVKLSPDVSGQIIQLPVSEGQAVKKGDLLFKIDPEILRSQVEQQQASLSATKASSLQAKAQLLRAEEEFNRSKELFGKQLISESEFTTSKTNLEVAKATYQASLFDIERVQSLLKQSRDQLSRTTIFAPISGTVSVLNNKLGERVVGTSQFAGTEILRIADLSIMEILVEVNENDIVNVKVGDTARVSVDAYPNRTFQGVVKEIANTAKTSSSGTQEEVTNFDVKIRIVDHGNLLRPGMSATADIETATVKDAVAVPIQSVTVRSIVQGLSSEELEAKRKETFGESGTDQKNVSTKLEESRKLQDIEKLARVVFIKQGEKVVMREVETGIADNTYIQITKGIQPGDEVVSGSYKAISRDLKDGSSVALAKKEKQ
ncbi:MAG: efflux RND transporter periplasmic adaptor subunit [Chlorobiales bacterium]|nr:efflux RND transporter periplasmic adaptor subunit [Chlorobiales bacterium]